MVGVVLQGNLEETKRFRHLFRHDRGGPPASLGRNFWSSSPPKRINSVLHGHELWLRAGMAWLTTFKTGLDPALFSGCTKL